MLKQLDRALNRITSAPDWRERLIHSRDLQVRAIDQQQVPASEKIVSLFEAHTNIIIKGVRDIQFGHKVNLSSDASGFLTYCCIEEGNTSDKDLFLPVLRAHQSDYQRLPKRTIADGGYASQANVIEGRQLGVQAVAFQKPVG